MYPRDDLHCKTSDQCIQTSEDGKGMPDNLGSPTALAYEAGKATAQSHRTRDSICARKDKTGTGPAALLESEVQGTLPVGEEPEPEKSSKGPVKDKRDSLAHKVEENSEKRTRQPTGSAAGPGPASININRIHNGDVYTRSSVGQASRDTFNHGRGISAPPQTRPANCQNLPMLLTMALQMALTTNMDPIPIATGASPQLSQSHMEQGSASVSLPLEPYRQIGDEETPIQGRPPTHTISDDSVASRILPPKGSHSESYPSDEPSATLPDSGSPDGSSSVEDLFSGRCCVEICVLAILVTASFIMSIVRRS
ncbi:hypothetical protein PM082_008948 [Marasmius tenuissimus]|nr:hypothetical protein PM082_008948 [Marasmius tenuissimus]